MSRRISIALSLFVSLFVASAANAMDVPTTAEVKKVLDFYYHGQGSGIVLIDSKICRDIHKEGDQRNDCSGEISSAEQVNKDEAVYLWMAYMIPTGDEKQKILIQFELGGVTRMVKDLEVSGSIRFRTWRKLKFDRTGEWTASIVHDGVDGPKKLGSKTFTVK